MPLTPLAPACFPLYQLPSNPPNSLCNSTTMLFLFARLIGGMTSSFAPPPVVQVAPPIAILPLIPHNNLSSHDPESIHLLLGTSSPLPSSSHHQGQSKHAIHYIIKQLHHHMKTERPYWKTLQFIAHNFRMTSPYCVTRSFLLLEPFPFGIIL